MTQVLIFSETDMADAPPKVDLHLAVGMDVIVLTHEGAVRRGRRRWHPGRSIGEILSKHRLHDRAWNVRVNGFTVILFEDELALPTEESP